MIFWLRQKNLYLSLRNENPACEKKTPEDSGVFYGQEENIGFLVLDFV
jgi:hypothetical protein